ncbi:hypothetical protein OTB19_43220, partial [Streptomyces sp. H27-H5]|nr:hypothetical protein [Streptomyces sp. H27-H5]
LRGALLLGSDGSVETPIIPGQRAPLLISPSTARPLRGGSRLKAPAELTGKERGKDLLADVHSLPVLLAREGVDRADAELRDLLAAGPVPAAALPRALELFERSTALDEAEAVMHRRLDRAKAALDGLPPLPAHRALLALCDHVALRTH